jgi:uncharacterized membrane protein YbjE (DUF340 family)
MKTMFSERGRMLERRGFVTGLLTVLSSVIGAVVGIPLVGYTVLPALNKRPEVFEKQASIPCWPAS